MGILAQYRYPSTQEVEARGSEAGSQPGLHREGRKGVYFLRHHRGDLLPKDNHTNPSIAVSVLLVFALSGGHCWFERLGPVHLYSLLSIPNSPSCASPQRACETVGNHFLLPSGGEEEGQVMQNIQ